MSLSCNFSRNAPYSVWRHVENLITLAFCYIKSQQDCVCLFKRALLFHYLTKNNRRNKKCGQLRLDWYYTLIHLVNTHSRTTASPGNHTNDAALQKQRDTTPNNVGRFMAAMKASSTSDLVMYFSVLKWPF